MMNCTTSHTLQPHRRLTPVLYKSCRSRVNLRVANMSETRTSLENTARQKLAGIYNDASRSDNVVILCHGYAGSKNGFCYPALAKALASKGFSSLRFDFSGNGESDGAFVFAGYHQEVADLRCAVQYVRETLRKKVVAIVGHSKGGNVVLLYASQYDDVPLVVNIAGRFHMAQGVKERFGEEVLSKVERLGEMQMTVKTDTGATVKWLLTKQSLEERMSLDMEAAARKITLSEVFTVHGTADTVIPHTDSEALAKCVRQHQLWLVPGADHNFRTTGSADQLIRKVVTHIADAQ